MSSLQQYIIRLKETASDADIASVKEHVKQLGGSIVSEFSLIKAFTATLPAFQTAKVTEHDHVDGIEEDKEVHIQ